MKNGYKKNIKEFIYESFCMILCEKFAHKKLNTWVIYKKKNQLIKPIYSNFHVRLLKTWQWFLNFSFSTSIKWRDFFFFKNDKLFFRVCLKGNKRVELKFGNKVVEARRKSEKWRRSREVEMEKLVSQNIYLCNKRDLDE